MTTSILINVYLHKDASKPIFARVLHQDSSVHIPFNLLLDSFHVLFGEKCIVEIKVHNYE